jgi:hypothetical protein
MRQYGFSPRLTRYSLAALSVAILGALLIASAPQLGDGHRFVELRNRAEDPRSGASQSRSADTCGNASRVITELASTQRSTIPQSQAI